MRLDHLFSLRVKAISRYTKALIDGGKNRADGLLAFADSIEKAIELKRFQSIALTSPDAISRAISIKPSEN